jgi:hypothetical protein
MYVRMRITVAHDKTHGKPHCKVHHPNIDEREIRDLFDGSLVVFGERKSILKAVGRTRAGRFLTVVFLHRKPDGIHQYQTYLKTLIHEALIKEESRTYLPNRRKASKCNQPS